MDLLAPKPFSVVSLRQKTRTVHSEDKKQINAFFLETLHI